MNSVLGNDILVPRQISAYVTTTTDVNEGSIQFSPPLANNQFSVFMTATNASVMSRVNIQVVSKTSNSFNFRLISNTNSNTSVRGNNGNYDVLIVQNGVVVLQNNVSLIGGTSAFTLNY